MTEQNNPGSAPQEPVSQPPPAAPQQPAAPQIPQQAFGDAPVPPAAPQPPTSTFGAAPAAAASAAEAFGSAPPAGAPAPPPPAGAPGGPLPASEAFGGAPDAAPPKKKRSVLKIVGLVVGIIIAVCLIGGFFLVRSVLSGDETKQAQAGDCIGNLPDVAEGEDKEASGAKVVECTSSDALYKVEGRLEDKTEEEAKQQDVCQAYPAADSWYRAIPAGGKGYVLCLSSVK